MKQSDISNFFKFWSSGGNWIIEIPKFQRSYEWDKKMINQMFNDIKKINIDQENENEIEHLFFGSMYFKKYKDKNNNCDIYQIIDGQQRMLTIFIYFIVIKNEEKFKDIYKNMGISLFNPSGNSTRFRFRTLISKDQEIIDSLLRKKDQKCYEDEEKKSKIYKAYDLIKNNLKKETKNLSPEDLKKYFDDFTKKLTYCEFAINELDEHNNMFQIFQSINSKAKSLTLLSLLNNFIMQYERDNEQITTYWKAIFNNFNKKLCQTFKFEYLLRYFFQYIFKKDIKINDLLHVFCDNFSNKDGLLNVLKKLDEFIAFIIDFKNKDNFAILLNDKAIILGQLFYCYKEYQSIYDYFKNILFSYLIRRNICECDSKGITAIIPSLIPKILNNNNRLNQNGIKSYFEELNGKNGYFPKDDEVKSKLLNTNLYFKKNIALPILKLIEVIYYQQSKINMFNLNNAEIEHIFPQSKQSALDDNINDDMKYKIVNSIGNLTLLPKPINSTISNNEFRVKKHSLCSSTYKMNTYFNNLNTWNKKSIEERSRVLADYVIKIFPSVFY